MFATTSFDLSLDSKIFAVLNEKFNADKVAINKFINSSLKNLLKTFKKVKVSKSKKEEVSHNLPDDYFKEDDFIEAKDVKEFFDDLNS